MIYLNQLGIVCPLGSSREEVKQRLLDQGESGVCLTEEYSPGRLLPLGRIDAEVPLPQLSRLAVVARSRNNQVALAALAQIRSAVNSAIEQYGKGRLGIVIGTSTSGIAESEAAFRHYTRIGSLPEHFHYGQQELGSLATLLAEELDVWGPAYVHSSACASSAKALASAARLLRTGACDAVLTGGVDTLCGFTVAGFAALESVSTTRCNPLSRNRAGINIGEGGALFLMSRETGPVALRGWGESSDGYHVSAPDPSGAGARLAIERALSSAGISAESIEYINLHGTGTVQNDAMEGRVIHELFGDAVAVSSTKPLTGHALGAAGAIEAGLCWLAMQDDNPDGRFPPHLWDGIPDPTLPRLKVAEPGSRLGRPLDWILSNSFAFGGANAALVFGRG
ncbi:MAG TPA: beta-ketoacyl-ACP synthase [Candidatus Polarisedimenticolaceae bacterium]|nr:beta-ketoacyl-ACP synthase [Candidatus Polarisedimenticolaceae bacterium]